MSNDSRACASTMTGTGCDHSEMNAGTNRTASIAVKAIASGADRRAAPATPLLVVGKRRLEPLEERASERERDQAHHDVHDERPDDERPAGEHAVPVDLGHVVNRIERDDPAVRRR